MSQSGQGPVSPETKPNADSELQAPPVETYDPANASASTPESSKPSPESKSSKKKEEKLISPEAVTPDKAKDSIEPPPKELEAQPQKMEMTPQSGELAASMQPEKRTSGGPVTPQQVLSKIAGYQSVQNGVNQSLTDDPNFPDNLIQFIQNGDPHDASVWQAVLLLKIYRILSLVFGG